MSTSVFQEGNSSRPQLSGTIVRVVETTVGAVFLYSGFMHLKNPFAFSVNIWVYELVPSYAISFLAVAIPSVMAATAIRLVLGIGSVSALVCLMSLAILFAFVQFVALAGGSEHSCGCFGYSTKQISLSTLLIPVVLAVTCGGSLGVRFLALRYGKSNG